VPWVYIPFLLIRRRKREKVTSGAIISKGQTCIHYRRVTNGDTPFFKGEVLMLNGDGKCNFFLSHLPKERDIV
jgi:hypothetical protein